MVAIIFCGDLKYCPYIKRYIERLDVMSIQYNVYFWNRGNFELELPDNYKYFDSFSELNKNKIKKGIDFFKFRIWLRKNLKKDKPEKLILLSTLTGILMFDFLGKFKNSYLFDIRDYSYEHIKLFYSIEKKVIQNSKYTVISSKGFKEFLPNFNYVIAHNFDKKDIKREYRAKKENFPIKIVWNGVMRYFEFQKNYINALKNDPRFLMIYHGDGPELDLYRNYCEEKNIKNVIFTGSYSNLEKENLLLDADILNNCYGIKGKDNKVKFAISNRFYDGLIYHIPQIVEPKGFKTNWIMSKKIGVNYEPDGNFSNMLFDYYKNLDRKTFDISCDEELKMILKEDQNFIDTIDSFIREE